MSRRGALVLLPVGPLCVGLLRFLLPGYTADDGTASARAVLAHAGRESAVLWLGLVAMLTLVPGIYAARSFLPPTRLRAWAMGLVVAGYLCLPALLASDLILWVGADQGLDPQVTGKLVDGVHPSFGVALGVFVVGHVLGTVLLGVACLRSRRLPAGICWALVVSQPLHFVTTVFLGLAWLDLLAWSLTAVAMGAIALGLVQGVDEERVLERV
jgi:hypothetical protein